MRQKRVFALTAYERAGGYADGCVRLHATDCGVYSTVRRAEKAVRALAAAAEEGVRAWGADPWFGFRLVEHRLDDCLDARGEAAGYRSCRTYLGDGRLNYFSDTDCACEKKFRGTGMPPRFRRGSFAWALCGSRAVPTLVEEEPMSRAEWRARLKRGAAGDTTDDSGVDFPLGAGGHQHTFAPDLFPPSALPGVKIPKEDKARMRAARDEWRAGGL